MKSLIKTGQRIYMVSKDIKGSLSTTINKIVGSTLSVNVLKDDLAFYVLGDVIEMFTIINDGILYFKPRVVEISKSENLIKVEFDKNKYEQLQRREFTRIEMEKEFALKVGKTNCVCKCLDISAGGMKFETVAELVSTQDYPVEFSLESKIPIQCFFQPIRIDTKGRGKNKKTVVSGRFVALKNIDKIAIVQYCFKKQSENKNR